MIIAIEGPDGAGKTTLARGIRALAAAADRQVFYSHEGPPPAGDALPYYVERLAELRQAEQALGPGGIVVADRFALGERVYGHLLRGVDALGGDGYRALDRVMTAWGVRQVVCLPPKLVCRDAWEKRRAAGREHILDEFAWTRSYDDFVSRAAEYSVPVYDWTQSEPAVCFAMLEGVR